MIEISTQLQPYAGAFEREIERDVESLTREILKDVVREAPEQMRSLMSDNPPSLVGSPPAKRSKTLFNSIEGDEESQTISMAGHAFFLDPIFEGKSAGYLNRPFIDKAISRTLAEIV